MSVTSLIDALFHCGPELNHAIQTHLKLKKAKKNEFLVLPGQIQKELYLVEEGIQMSFFESKRNIHVMAFTYFPGICAIPESFIPQKPSEYSLQCLSPSKLWALSYTVLNELFSQHPELERIFRQMAEHVLVGVLQRHRELHSLSMEERYLQFCQRSPHLLLEVPHKYLASYLSIDPSNFSKLYNRIRI